METTEYFEKITNETYIQQWFVDEPITQDSAVDCIIEAYPLTNGVTKEDVEEWVSDEVTAYNDGEDDCNKLPLDN